MSRTKVYENVSKKRLACMKSKARSKVKQYARDNGYDLAVWDVPDGDAGNCHVYMKGRQWKKPDLDFLLHFNRDNSERLTVRLMQLPVFISQNKAMQEADKIYRSCSK